MKTTTRTLRLTAATAAALVLMTGAAQAHPIGSPAGVQSSPSGVAYSGTYRPTSPANNVALAHGATTVTLAPDRVDRIGEAPRFTPQGNVPDRIDEMGTAQQHAALTPLAPAGTIVVHSTTTKSGGFDWTAALIGAGTALLIVLIVGGGGMTLRGRRSVALSS